MSADVNSGEDDVCRSRSMRNEIIEAIQSLNSLIDGDSDDALGVILTPVVSLLERIVTPMVNHKRLAVGICYDNGGFVGSAQIGADIVADMHKVKDKLIEAGMDDCDSILLIDNNELVFHWDTRD